MVEELITPELVMDALIHKGRPMTVQGILEHLTNNTNGLGKTLAAAGPKGSILHRLQLFTPGYKIFSGEKRFRRIGVIEDGGRKWAFEPVNGFGATQSKPEKASFQSFLDPEDSSQELFEPSNIDDARQAINRTIKERRGQQAFRRNLICTYDGKCAVTGCSVLDILEAAHVYPYRGAKTHHISNGLLLRADLHTLFDCGLVGIDPHGSGGKARIVLASTLRRSEYAPLAGKALRNRRAGAVPLNNQALALRYEEFCNRHIKGKR